MDGIAARSTSSSEWARLLEARGRAGKNPPAGLHSHFLQGQRRGLVSDETQLLSSHDHL